VGSFTGTTLELGQLVCFLVWKNSTKVERTLAPDHSLDILTEMRVAVPRLKLRKTPNFLVGRHNRIKRNMPKVWPHWAAANPQIA